MNLKAWIPLIIAVVLGLVAAMFAMKLTRTQTTGIARVDGTVQVVTAARNIAPGQEIKAADLAMKTIAVDDAPENTFLQMEQVVGRVAQGQIVRGQPIFADLLAPEGIEAGLQALIPEGMRAITIEVDEFSGLAGLIRPGSIVDVMSTLRGDDEDVLARTIVQSVKVTAVGQRVSTIDEADDGEKKLARSVTLLVTPEQAERIELAAITSRPRLVLRSPTDTRETLSRGVTLADLRGRAANSLHDPFETRPVDMTITQPVNLQQVEQSTSTTKPVDAQHVERSLPNQNLRSPFQTETREITVIRGGVESKVFLEYRRPDNLITGVEIEPIELNK